MDGECWKRIEPAARVKKRREKVGRRGGGGGQFRAGKFKINSRVGGNKRTQREKQKKKEKRKKKKKIPVSSLTGDCIRSMKDPMKDPMKDESSPS